MHILTGLIVQISEGKVVLSFSIKFKSFGFERNVHISVLNLFCSFNNNYNRAIDSTSKGSKLTAEVIAFE